MFYSCGLLESEYNCVGLQQQSRSNRKLELCSAVILSACVSWIEPLCRVRCVQSKGHPISLAEFWPCTTQAHWVLNRSSQLTCRGRCWHNGSDSDGPQLCVRRKAHQKTFPALRGFRESWHPSHESAGPPRPPTAPCERSQPTGADDQPAPVSAESPAQVFVEAPLRLALPRTCWCS